jgi:hypothetical protein
MRKERKVKTQKHSRNTIIIIVAILGVFLAAIILGNVRTAFKKIEVRNCFRGMLLMEEGMLQMKKEFRFDVSPQASFDDLVMLIAEYFHFGEVVFDNPTTGTLRLKPGEKLVHLPLVDRRDRYLLDTPRCPSKGKYTLIPSLQHPGLFDISCSVHGTLYLPDKEGKYSFTGDFDVLNPRRTALGREADIRFSPDESRKEYVTIIPYVQPQPTAKEAHGSAPAPKENLR